MIENYSCEDTIISETRKGKNREDKVYRITVSQEGDDDGRVLIIEPSGFASFPVVSFDIKDWGNLKNVVDKLIIRLENMSKGKN